MYSSRKFVSQPETLEPKAKCEILKIQRYPMPLMLIGLIMVMSLVLIQNLLPTVGYPNNAFLDKITVSLTLISVFSTFSGLSMLQISFPIEKLGIINLSLIENIEKVVEGDPIPIRVWNMLFKNAVRDTELLMRNLTGVSQVNFYEPFNTVSLALALGNKKERSSAKKWISKLLKMFEKKNVNDAQRAKRKAL